MGNRALATACEIIITYPAMTDMLEFSEKFTGRYTRSIHPKVKTEIENYAERQFAIRRGLNVSVAAPSRLKAYLTPWFDQFWNDCFRYYNLNPTKGWRGNSIDFAEGKYLHETRRVPIFLRWNENGDAVVWRAA